MLKEQIQQWAEAHQKEFIQDLASLIAVPSVASKAKEGMPFGKGPADALAKVVELCGKYNLLTKNWENYVGTADLAEEKEPGLDILAHLDVVGPGDGWDTEPYVMTEKDGVLYGRGVADDKGGLLAAAYAMRCVKELGLPVSKRCRLIMGCDEETNMEDVKYYYAKENPAPNTVSPDAEFPVCNVEKGWFRPVFTMNFAETEAEPRVTELHGGFRTNVVPGEAFAILKGISREDLEKAVVPLCAEVSVGFDCEETENGTKLMIHGTGCHAAEPQKGNNANTALIRVLSSLPLANCDSTNAIKSMNSILPHGDYLGQNAGIAQEDDLAGELTCSFTMIDFDEKKLKGLCDCRVPLSADKMNCQDVFEANLKAYGFRVRSVMMEGHYTPEDSEFVQTLLRCYEEFTGEKGECYSMGGGTYVHHVDGGVAFGAGMQDWDPRMHGANECMRIEDLLKCMEIYAAAIANICK